MIHARGEAFWIVGLAVLFACLAPTRVGRTEPASDKVLATVNELLSEKSTRMVVVDFFSTSCPPCRKAIPQWERLKRDYGSRGLRLVVVAEDQAGTCATRAWSPDRWICDEHNTIATAWGADYGHAYVWTWQGVRTHEKITIDDVEGLVKDAFKSTLRIEISRPRDAFDRPLDDTTARTILLSIQRVLQEQTRFELLPEADLANRLRALRASRQGPDFDERGVCSPGKDLAPNSALLCTLADDNLTLELWSLDNLCPIEIASVPARARPLGEIAREATGLLAARLIRAPAAPRPLVTSSQTGRLYLKADRDVRFDVAGEQAGYLVAGRMQEVLLQLTDRPYHVTMVAEGCYPYEADVLLTPAARTYTVDYQFVPRVDGPRDGEPGILTVRSKPSGAEIWINGVKMAEPTNADFSVPSGRSVVEIRRANHKPWTTTVQIRPNDTVAVDAALEPSVGELLVSVVPADARILLDGRPVGERGAYRNRQEQAGGHELVIESPDYHTERQVLEIPGGGRRQVDVALRPAFGSLRFHVTTDLDDGDAVTPRLFIDDQPRDVTWEVVGGSPGERFRGSLERVPSGRRRLELQLDEYTAWKGVVEVTDEEANDVEVQLSAAFGVLRVESTPEGVPVRIGDQMVGRTPVAWRGAPGTYLLRVNGADATHATVVTDVPIQRGKAATLHYELKPRVGKVHILTQPSGARIRFDGKDVGESPRILTEVPIGSHKVEVSLDGFTDEADTLEVREGETTVSKLSLGVLMTSERGESASTTREPQGPRRYGLIRGSPWLSGELRDWNEIEWPSLAVSIDGAGVTPRFGAIRFSHPDQQLRVDDYPLGPMAGSAEWWFLPFIGIKGDLSEGGQFFISTSGATTLKNEVPFVLKGGVGLMVRPWPTGPASRVVAYGEFRGQLLAHGDRSDDEEGALVIRDDNDIYMQISEYVGGITIRPFSFLDLQAEYARLMGSWWARQPLTTKFHETVDLHNWRIRAKLILWDFHIDDGFLGAIVVNAWYSRALLESDNGNFAGRYLYWGVSASFTFLFDLD